MIKLSSNEGWMNIRLDGTENIYQRQGSQEEARESGKKMQKKQRGSKLVSETLKNKLKQGEEY